VSIVRRKIFDLNRVGAIAMAVEALSENEDHFVTVDGFVAVGNEQDGEVDFLDMDPGEAARCVVETVLDHPHVKEILDESEGLWRTIEWLLLQVYSQGQTTETPPSDIKKTLSAAADALWQRGEIS